MQAGARITRKYDWRDMPIHAVIETGGSAMPQCIKALIRASAAAGFVLVSAAAATAEDNPLQNGSAWEDLKSLVQNAASAAEDKGILILDAPVRAMDPAFVPVHLTQPDGAPPIRTLTVIIDENPAPVAAEMTLGAAMMPLDMEIRMRVNAYSNVRAVATTDTASILAGRYVKATGGCAAPASKDLEAMLAEMGQMRFQIISSEQTGTAVRHMAKLMLRHPNTTGFQRDQVTLLNIPAHFIDVLEVRQGDDLLFKVEAGISISEDPVFQFRFTDNGADTVTVHAEDTDGNVFDESFTMLGL
jgi:sulfur-oxidizing protein SoxY